MDKPGEGIDKATVLLPNEGDPFDFGGLAGQWKIGGANAGDRFAVAHFPHIPPRVLAAPLHLHHNEDEYTCVLEGTLGTLAGDEVITAGPGTWVRKPRLQWHTFWNAGDVPCQTLEIVSPASMKNYFREVAVDRRDMRRLAQTNEKYGIEMDFESVPALCERFGLKPLEL